MTAEWMDEHMARRAQRHMCGGSSRTSWVQLLCPLQALEHCWTGTPTSSHLCFSVGSSTWILTASLRHIHSQWTLSEQAEHDNPRPQVGTRLTGASAFQGDKGRELPTTLAHHC